MTKEELIALPPWTILVHYSKYGYKDFAIKRSDNGQFISFDEDGQFDGMDDMYISPSSYANREGTTKVVDDEVTKQEAIDAFHNMHDDHCYGDDDNNVYWEYDYDDEDY